MAKKMSSISKVRTIVAIVCGLLMILPLFLGLWTSSYWGSGYVMDVNDYDLNTKSYLMSNMTMSEWASQYGYNLSPCTYTIWGSLKIDKEVCDLLFAKGGAFSWATLAKIFIIVTIVASLLLVVVEILRFCNIHLTTLEETFVYFMFFSAIIALFASCMFFIGASCRGSISYVRGQTNNLCMMFNANIGWYIAIFIPLALGITMMSIKPHRVD